eukprot:439774-Pyramimonas_sp.AAC.1
MNAIAPSIAANIARTRRTHALPPRGLGATVLLRWRESFAITPTRAASGSRRTAGLVPASPRGLASPS